MAEEHIKVIEDFAKYMSDDITRKEKESLKFNAVLRELNSDHCFSRKEDSEKMLDCLKKVIDFDVKS